MPEKEGTGKKKTDWVAFHKAELVTFIANFYQTSYNWRESSGYHTKWDKFERNANAIYDPTNKAKKKPWQACMFDPSITPTNVELTTNALTKALTGKPNPLGIEPREMGDELQAELNTTILDYEVARSNFVIADYDANKEACIYGSGFLKFYWVKKYAERRVLADVKESFVEAAKNFRLPQVKGFKEKIQMVLIKNDPVCEKIHIRDIFLEPNSTGLDRVLHRNKNLTYGELLNLSKQKNAEGKPLIDPESVKELQGVTEGPKFDADLSMSMADKGITEGTTVARPDYDKKHTVWEYWGPLPRKWVELGLPEDTDEQKEAANEIVPGKAMVASAKYFLASEVNPQQSMEPPFIQKDYIRTNQRYGIGVCQLLEGIQDEANEIRNLRADNVTLSMNKMFGVVEKFMVDSDDAVSEPGRVWRFKSTEDIRKVFMEIQVSDTAISAFRETGELERKAQETVGNNRVTMGTAGMTKDTNQTLGGMELLKQSAFDRFTMYAYIMGCTSNIKSAKKLMELSYQNRDMESIKRILGMEPIEIMPRQYIPKWQAYKRIPPNELELDYDFVFTDVFKAENKAQKLTSLMNYGQFLATVFPQLDMRPIAEEAGRLNDFSPELLGKILAGVEGPMPTPMGMGQGVPSLTKPTRSFSGGEAAPMAVNAGTVGPGQ